MRLLKDQVHDCGVEIPTLTLLNILMKLSIMVGATNSYFNDRQQEEIHSLVSMTDSVEE